MAKKRIELREAPRKRAICETKMRYEVYLDGRFFSDIYFNLRGYVGYLPTADGHRLDIGEVGITAFRKEIAKLNRELASI